LTVAALASGGANRHVSKTKRRMTEMMEALPWQTNWSLSALFR